MKKLWAVLLCFVLLFAMTACENSAPAASEEINGTNESDEVVLEEVSEVKTAVVCFSGTGNTMAVAETIADVTGGDLFEIIDFTVLLNNLLILNSCLCLQDLIIRSLNRSLQIRNVILEFFIVQ